jgi:hypothetical protein
MKKPLYLFLFLAIFSVAACDQNDGPLEKTGENIDEAYTDMGNAIEDKCEDIKKNANAEDTDC